MYDNVWTQFSLKDFSISSVFNFVTDLDENPSSEECCDPEGVAKYEGKNEAKEESLMKACMEFAGQDLDRLEVCREAIKPNSPCHIIRFS